VNTKKIKRTEKKVRETGAGKRRERAACIIPAKYYFLEISFEGTRRLYCGGNGVYF